MNDDTKIHKFDVGSDSNILLNFQVVNVVFKMFQFPVGAMDKGGQSHQ